MQHKVFVQKKLKQNKKKGHDVVFALQAIEAKRKTKTKYPHKNKPL